MFTQSLFAALIVTLTVWRFVTATNEGLANFSPLMALAFCGAVYFRAGRTWLIPFAVLVVSESLLNSHYGFGWNTSAFIVKLACFAIALIFGLWVSRNRTWFTILGGCLASSCIFFLCTNSLCWLQEPGYAKTLPGWWQCMTTGLPGFPPTWFFFRNSLLSDLIFTGIFAVVLESVFASTGHPNLFPRHIKTRISSS